MLLVTDNKIPFIDEFFSPFIDIRRVNGHEITPQDLINADILLTRTITRVTKDLIQNTPIQFIGTATAGVDHIDVDYLHAHKIQFATAAGANATAVSEYVVCCLAALKKAGYLIQKSPVIGVIGCGNVGSLLGLLLQSLGFEVICYDPLLVNQPSLSFTDFDTLISESDVITIHTPLTTTGLYPTYHLLNALTFDKMKPNSILINTARGGVIDENALLATQHITCCIDVWTNEPEINLQLLNKTVIGTPHIAGYTIQAKRMATEMIFTAAANYFGWHKTKPAEAHAGAVLKTTRAITKENWEITALSHFDPIKRADELKNAIKLHPAVKTTEIFNQQRHLPLRDGFLAKL